MGRGEVVYSGNVLWHVSVEVPGLVFSCSVLPLPIAGLSCIKLCVSGDLVTFLIPELSKLAEAMKLRVKVSPSLSIVSL